MGLNSCDFQRMRPRLSDRYRVVESCETMHGAYHISPHNKADRSHPLVAMVGELLELARIPVVPVTNETEQPK